MEIIPDFWVLWTLIAFMMVLAVIVEVRRWLELRERRQLAARARRPGTP